ncbi:MAG: tRNA (adenosine(37)-N6)-threonylcarbamoyltransferase complex dimerization subunit type 1 TsaB [Jiangellales bacterium]
MLLAWDTSTDVVTVALHDGTAVVGHRTGSGARRHAEVLTPLVAGLLSDAQMKGTELDGLAVGVGPGAYTGLRVGLVTAQALALAWGVPVRGACSLDALAVQAVAEHPHRYPGGLLVLTDARRRQVFWARYNATGARVSGPAVDAPDAVATVASAGGGVPAVGSGAAAHRGLFPSALEPSHPDAAWLAQGLSDGTVNALPVEPLYLRQPDVTVGAGVKPVLQPGRLR